MFKRTKRLFCYLTVVLVMALCAGTFTACKADTVDLVSNMVQLEYTSVVYDGTEKKPAVSIVVDETTIDSEEYLVEYLNNTEVGTAIVKITASESSNKIKGTMSVGFEIVQANAVVTDLNAINEAIENVNYSGVVVSQAFTLSSTEKLTIPENFVVNFGNNILTNNGNIINNGTIIANKGIEGSGTISGDGEIRAEVSNIEDFCHALTFANTVKVMANIPAGATVEENKLDLFSDTKYNEITIDLNGHTVNRQFRFDAKHGSKTIEVTNTAENEAVINTRGLKELPAIFCRGNADHENLEVNVKLSNIKVVGDDIGSNGNQWAAITTNGLSSGEYYNIYAKDCEFVGGETSGAYLPARYNYKFVDCTFSGITGYYTKSGNHKLINCTINGTRSAYIEPNYHNNGCYETGSALVLDSSKSYLDPLNVVVNGGTFNSKSGYSIEEYATSSNGKLNYYSDLEIKGSPKYSYGSGRAALAVPTFVALDIMDNAQDVVDDLFEKVYNNPILGESVNYTFETLAETVADVKYYIEIGSISYMTNITELSIGETVFTKDQIIEVSIGNNNKIMDKAYYVKDGSLYVAANIILFEAQEAESIKLNGKEYEIDWSTALRRVSVTNLNYRGTGNNAVAVDGEYNVYDLTVADAYNDSYLEIFYANADSNDIIVTKKVNNDKISYGLTGVESGEGTPLGYYPVGYWEHLADIPREKDNTTIEYSFYVVGKGVATIILNIDLVDVA